MTITEQARKDLYDSVDVSRDTRAWALSIMSLNAVMTAAAIALSRI